MHVVLFDLDGTVLTFDGPPPGPGRTALDRAMRELFGIDRASDGMRFAGGTDRALARALLERAGAIIDESSIARVLASYVAHLEDVLGSRSYRPVGDVLHAVAACRARGAVVGVATGNIRAGARLKLSSAKLLEAFDLDRGGYGDDAEPRADILRAAVARCADARREIVVVGDTENDVRAARAIGARVVGVAVSASARDELERAGADAIVDACGAALVEAIFAAPPV
jgi:phosphoglycolate phosphatase-like HAD superfamily hydrolase